MATWYVNSAAAGTGAGTSWVNACTTLAAAIALSAAGDDFNVLSTHAETQGSTLTLAFKGTAASPNRVFSCTNTHTPAQAGDLLAGASITSTGAFGIVINGFVYIYGVTFNNSTGTTGAAFALGNGVTSDLTFDTCALKHKATTAQGLMVLGSASVFLNVSLINTTVNFDGGTTSGISLTYTFFTWKNTVGAITGTQTAIANLFQPSGARNSVILCDGVDFNTVTGIASGKNLVSAHASDTIAQFVNCRLTSGVLFGTPTVTKGGTDVIVSDSGATGYRQERYTYQGSLTTSTTVTNNATDGVTAISWKVITSANAKLQSPFECFDIVQWVAAGTYAASLIQITSATASLTNADVFVDVEYLGNASFPISSLVSSGPATQLTAGSSLAAGTWATGGLGNNYKLAIPSFTTALAGYVRFKVRIAKASLTLNIDPAVTVA